MFFITLSDPCDFDILLHEADTSIMDGNYFGNRLQFDIPGTGSWVTAE